MKTQTQWWSWGHNWNVLSHKKGNAHIDSFYVEEALSEYWGDAWKNRTPEENEAFWDGYNTDPTRDYLVRIAIPSKINAS